MAATFELPQPALRAVMVSNVVASVCSNSSSFCPEVAPTNSKLLHRECCCCGVT